MLDFKEQRREPTTTSNNIWCRRVNSTVGHQHEYSNHRNIPAPLHDNLTKLFKGG